MDKSIIDELTKEQCKELILKLVENCTNDNVIRYILHIVTDAVE